MDHLAEGFPGGALAPAAMPWRSAASRSLPKAAKTISRFHDCPLSKHSHDTIPLYQGDVARHRIGIVCISGSPETRVRWRTTCARQQCLGIVAENGKVNYGFHTLRHTAASLFIAHLMDLEARAWDYDRYGHLFTDRERVCRVSFTGTSSSCVALSG
jgi:hypothetical protein